MAAIAPWHDPRNIPGPGMADWLEENKKHVPTKILHGSFVSDVLIPDPGKDITEYGVIARMIDGTVAIFNPETNSYSFGMRPVSLLAHHFNPNTDANEIKRIYDTLAMVLSDTPELQVKSNPNYISYSNGMLDVTKYRETGSVVQSLIQDEAYKYGTKFSLTWPIKDDSELDPDAVAYVQQWVDILKGHSEEDVEQFQMIMGSLFWGRAEKNSVCVVQYSEGQSGKSVVDHYLYDTVFPQGSVSYVKIHDLADDNKVIDLINSIVNIDSDCDESLISSQAFANFKCVISGDPISARKVYESTQTFTPYATLIINTNYMLKFGYKADGHALNRRLCFSNFPQCFDENNPETDKDVEEKLRRPEVVEAFMKWCLDGLVKWLDNGKVIPETAAGLEIAEYFKTSNNSIRQWMAEFKINEDCLVNPKDYTIFIDGKIGLMDPYEQYLNWCKEMNIGKPVAKTGFSRFLQKQFKNIETGGRRTIRPGKTVATFKYKDDAPDYDPSSDKGNRPIRIEELKYFYNLKETGGVDNLVEAYRKALRQNAEALEKKNDKYIEDALTMEFLDIDRVVAVAEDINKTNMPVAVVPENVCDPIPEAVLKPSPDKLPWDPFNV